MEIKITFYKETNFKETPIGKIPKDWGFTRLEKICKKVKAGGTPLTNRKEFWNGDIPFVKIEDITSTGKYLIKTKASISKSGLENSSAWMVPEGSLLLAMYGSLGEISITKIPVATNQAILGIIPKNKEDIEFLYYWYLYFKSNWRKYAKPTTQANLTAHIVRNSIVPLPPPLERKAIAYILSTVDKAIQKTNEIIEKTERLKKGLMQELLTKGIGHKEFKDTEIGRIPKEWKITKLRDVVQKFISGGTPSTKDPSYWNGSIPWITSAHINKWYVDSGERYITIEGLKNSATNIVPKGNIIIATRVGIGKAALNLINVAINQDLTGLIINKQLVDPEFLVWYLISPKVITLLHSFTRGTTIKGISRKDLERLRILLPPLDEQKEIARVLFTVDKKLEVEKKEKQRLEKIKQALMDLLLTGKVRVKVNEGA